MNEEDNLNELDESNESSPLDEYYASKTEAARQARLGNGMPENQDQEFEEQPKSKEETDATNNANTLKNAVKVAKAVPAAAPVAHAVDAVDGATGGKVTKTAGKLLQKVTNKVPVAGDLVQNISNNLSESGIGDVAGKTADMISGKAGIDNASRQVASATEGLGDVADSNNSNKIPLLPTKKQSASKETDPLKGIADKFFKKHKWKIILIGGGALILLILFIALFTAIAGENEQQNENQGAPADLYNYNNSLVFVTYPNGESVRVDYPDYVKGVVYHDYAESITDKETLKALIITYKSLVLAKGNYNSQSKQMAINGDINGLRYCDIYNGCNEQGGFYYSNASMDGVSPDIPAASDNFLSLLNEAYNEVQYELLLPASFTATFLNYTFDTPVLPDKNTIISFNNSGKTYSEIIEEIYAQNNWGIYNLEDHIVIYQYGSVSSHWWPIGSKTPSVGNIYGGDPVSTKISSHYGFRTDPITGKSNTKHNGVDISASCGVPVIATRSGTVIESTYNSACGNLVRIDHGDGTYTRYCHMEDYSVTVQEDDTVSQGQIIGMVGSTGKSTGCHLHYEVWLGDSMEDRVDPEDYISAENPRPRDIDSTYQKGATNMQSVCLTLKASGFSDNAVIALMANIHSESSFRLDALGDSGTSYGLCQWHNGRKANLENYCGTELNTVDCQVSYLIYELRGSYTGVYNTLLASGTAHDMAETFCHKFEVPANAATSCANRANSNVPIYENYVKNGCM